MFKIPYTTLADKVKGKVPVHCKPGINPVLTMEEEALLVKWILHTSNCGFPITKSKLCDSVQMLMQKLKRENPFTDGRPGNKWYASFMKRHPEIASAVQNLTSSSSAITDQKIKNWFSEVNNYLKTNNFDDALLDPKRIFNCGEISFFLCPKGDDKVLLRNRQKCMDEKDCITTLIMCRANGDLPPPMIVHPCKRITASIALKSPSEWAIGRSESGLITRENFFEYIANIFLPWLRKSNVPLPILLFVDGHSSPLSMPLSDLCSQNGLIVISFLPNSTRFLQPLDVGMFHLLKKEWKKVMTNWRKENDETNVRKEDFAPLLDRVFNNLKDSLPIIIPDAFKTCGIHPFTPDNIQFNEFSSHMVEKQPLNQEPNWEENTNTTELEKFLLRFEQRLGDKIEIFKSSGEEWNGDVADKNLFYYWRSIKLDITSTVKVQENGEGNIDESNGSIQTNTKTTNEDDHLRDIPSPFREVLFWPSKTKINLDQNPEDEEKVPPVVTSPVWKEHYKQKEAKRLEVSKAKKRKQKVRQKKKK